MAFSITSDRLAIAAGDPFARITPDDHSAILWITTLLSTIYAALVLAVRLGFTKWRAHALDDIIVTIAHLLAFGMWGSLWTCLRSGLGKSYYVLNDAEIVGVQQKFFTSRILLFIALALSKSSILVLIRGVFAGNSKVSILSFGTIAFVAIWSLIGVFATTVGCSVDAIIPRSGDNHCVNSIPWLRAAAATDVVTEIVIMGLPIIGFHSSLMSISRKTIVVMAFFTRVPNIAFAIKHFLAYSKFVNGHEAAISIVSTVTWQSILLSYSLISATTPLLKGFTQGFMTAGIALGYSREGTKAGGSGTSRSYQLRSLTRPKSRPNVPNGMPQDVTKPSAHNTSVLGNVKQKSAGSKTLSKDDSQRYHESASIASYNSRQIIIKQEWRITED